MNTSYDVNIENNPLNFMAKTYQALSVQESLINSKQSPLLYKHNSKLNQANDVDFKNSSIELVEYPANIITTVIEKRSSIWDSSSSLNNIKSNKPNEKSMLKPIKDNLEASKKVNNNQNSCEQENHIVEECNYLKLKNSKIDAQESFMSKDIVLSSLFSTSTSSCNDNCAQVNLDQESIIFNQKRKISNLKGRLESLILMINEMTKERSLLHIKLHDLEKKLNTEYSDYFEILEEKKKFQKTNKDLQEKITKWESVIEQYPEVIETKTQEIKEMSKELEKIGAENLNLKLIIEPLKNKIADKNLLIDSLKAEISNKSGDINQLKEIISRLNEKINFLNSEISIRCQQKNLYQNECSKILARFNELQQKLVEEQNEKFNLKTYSNNLNKEKNDIKLILDNLQKSNSDEKKYFWRSLESIKIDIAKALDINQYSNKNGQEPDGEPKKDNRNIKNLPESSKFNYNQLLEEITKLKSANQVLTHDKQVLSNKFKLIEKELNDVKINLISEQGSKSKLETQLKGLNIEFRSHKNMIEALKQDTIAAEEKCSQLIRDNQLLESNTRILKERLETSTYEVKQAKADLDLNIKKVKLIEKEKLKLEQNLAKRNLDLDNLKNRINISMSEESLVSQLKFEKQELGKVITSLSNDLKSLQIRFEQEKCIWSDTQKNLLSKLESANQREAKLKIQVNSVMEEFEELKKKRSNVKENFDQIKVQNTELNNQSENSKDTINLNQDDSQIDSSAKVFSNNHDLLKQMIEEKDKIIKKDRLLILELEHQKGIKGDQEIFHLKEKMTSMESELKSKDSEALGMRSKLKNLEEKYKQELELMVSKCQTLQNDLKKERLMIKDLRHSIFIEKRDLYNFKREVAFLKTRLSQSNYVSEKRKQELINLNQSLQQMQINDNQYKSEVQVLKNDLYQARLDFENLSKSIKDDKDKNNPLGLELNNLMLNIKERDQIIEALRLEIENYCQRQLSLEKSIQEQNEMFRKDIESLNYELEQTCKDKFYFQTQVNELMKNLSQSLQKNQNLISIIEESKLALPDNLLNDLKSCDSKNQKSMDVQLCFETLKQKMDLLQEKIRPNYS